VKKVNVLVEGHTEERLVNLVLQPELMGAGVWLNPVILTTRRSASGPNHHGGVTSWAKMRNDIRRLLGDSSAHLVTTLIDFYGLPVGTPGLGDQPPGADPYARVAHVERAIGAEIADRRFLPFLALHETEAWVLAAAQELAGWYDLPDLAADLSAQVKAAGGPEYVNDGPETAPSKRIIRAYPGYRKVADGPDAISLLGVPALRAVCPHLDAWLSGLEGGR
jgi:hypothetical protein